MYGFDMRQFMEKLWPLDRTLASRDMRLATKITYQAIPATCNPWISEFAAGEQAFTWQLPGDWTCDEAYLLDEQGQRWADYAENPLHVVSYSTLRYGGQRASVSWEELDRHLHVGETGVPWRYHFYQNDWGFCVDRATYERMPRGEYQVVLKAHAEPHGIQVVSGLYGNRRYGEVWLQGHLCHPRQANDGLSGVAVALEVLHRIVANPPETPCRALRVVFGPETVGTIALLALHQAGIPRIAGSIFVETAGLDYPMLVQEEKTPCGDLSWIATTRPDVQGIEWRTGPINDELVFAMPGINRPAISFSRWDMEKGAFPQYHTDADNMASINWDRMEEMAWTVESTVRLAMTNLTPVPLFKGPIHLARYGLWNEFGGEYTDRLMAHMNGKSSLWLLHHLADAGEDFDRACRFCHALYEKGLIEYATDDLRAVQ